MTTIKVKFRPSTVVGRPGSIVYLITCHRVVRQITSEYKVFPEEWDEERSTVLLGHTERTDIRAISRKLRDDIARLKVVIEGLNSRQTRFTADDVVEKFHEVTADSSFFRFMQKVIERLKRLGKERSVETYTTTLNSFMRFRKGFDIEINEINSDLMMEYEAYLKMQNVSMNTISFYNRILRAVYNRAVEKELTVQRNPFKHVYTGVSKTVKRAIPLNAIKRIKELDLSLKPSMDFARDMFMFSFYTRGMSFIDMAYMKKTDLQYGILSYCRRKTGQRLYIKWEKCMQDILDKYPENDTNYLLPIITRADNERRQYQNALRLVNNKLKEIARLADVRLNLTMYVTRHSWASIAKSQNIPLAVISEGMGHDSEVTTQIYLTSLDSSTIDKANGLILKKL
ncbi:MAG TPA: site-specific integrase [Candidatus Butyricimonas faecavium]|nr:site-specific integrase [Candidatus Butyricimonas faecavium]